ncbi:MAG: PfkB family carbohydrate kinase, partial [Atribacterota bacterium]
YPELDVRMRKLELKRQGGGEAPTALVTLARLGMKTSFIGKIGDDEPGSFILSGLAEEGVDTSHMVVEKGVSSIIAFCIIEKGSGKRTIVWYKELKPLEQYDFDPEFLCSGKILHLDHHEPESATIAASLFKSTGRPIVLDIDSYDYRMEQLLSLVDVAIGSENFARCFNPNHYEEAVQKIHHMGPKIVVLTLGEKGCLCYDGVESFIEPGFSVDVVDTTGCGDVFHGAFIYGLLQKWDLRTTARFSNAMAALKCTKLGGRTGIPNRQQVETFLSHGVMRKNSE